MADLERLRPDAAREARKTVPQWTCRGGVLRREFIFEDFAEALRFVNRVARIAEKAQHHPDVDIRWNRVRLAWTTHDVGGLTLRDFELARRSDKCLAPPVARPRPRRADGV